MAKRTEFAARSVSIVDAHIRVVGNLAWQIGLEVGHARMKEGIARNIDWIVTNVFEKIDGLWFMVVASRAAKAAGRAEESMMSAAGPTQTCRQVRSSVVLGSRADLVSRTEHEQD